MGNSHPPIGQYPSQQSKLIDSQTEFQVYETASGEQYQKYTVVHDGSQHFEQLYRFRIENKHNDLVDLLYAGPAQGFMGCTERSKFQVITQRIPYRLQALSALHSKNSLVILRTCLRGFRDIYRKHGVVGIRESMMGINSKNRVKVWLNHNFAINRPEPIPTAFVELNPHDQEREMVLSLFDLIDSKTEHDALWIELIRLRQHRNPSTFDEALNLIDYFSGAHRINISDTVNNLFNKRYYNAEGKIEGQQHHLNYHDEKIQKLNQQFAEISSRTVRRPFEEIQSKLQKINAIPSYHQQLPNIIHSHIAGNASPSFAHVPLTYSQNPMPVHTSNQRPMIKFTIKGKTTQEIPPFIHNQQQPQQNITSQNTPVSVLTITKPIQIKQVQVVKSENAVITSTNNAVQTIIEPQAEAAPTFSEIPISIKVEQPQQPTQQKERYEEVREVDSYFPQTEQQQIILPPQPIQFQNATYLEVDQAYQVQIHEVSSQESLHEQLTTLLTEQNKENQQSQQAKQQAKEIQYKIILTKQNERNNETMAKTEKNLQTLKTVINASLVDTREIKRKSAQFIIGDQYEQSKSGKSLRGAKNASISYRQMRRLLLEELSN